MSPAKVWLVLGAAAAFGAGVALTTAVARAGDDKAPAGPPPGMPPPQKVIKHPYVDCLLGTWSTASTSDMGNGKGSATFALGVGGTALLEDYQMVGTGMTGQEEKFYGHGVYKLSDDGKTVTCWWFDTLMGDAMKMTGPITDKGLEMTADMPFGKFKVVMEKTAEGQTFKMYIGDKLQMTDVYKPNPK